MLGRRSLRVKTMQVLYGYELNKESELSSLELQLIRNMDKTVTMYLLYIAYLNEVCQYSLVDTALKMAKYIQTDELQNLINWQNIMPMSRYAGGHDEQMKG